MGEKMLGKKYLALNKIGLQEALSRLGQADVAFRNLRESDELKVVRRRKQVIDSHLQARRQGRQIGPAVIWFRGHGLHETRQNVRRHARQDHCNASAWKRSLASGLASRP